MSVAVLNPNQQTAVQFGPGPVLVLAGAGAGKTRVLTYRVAHLIQQKKVSPARILVMTFTNKAAREMKERLVSLIGTADTSRIWAGTFHSICVRLLRQEAEAVGYTRRFVIYDSQDQEKLMREILRELDLDPTQYRPRNMLKQVSGLKNQGLSPAAFRQGDLEFHEMTLARVYERYQEQIARHNAMDFDDLLLVTLQMLQRHPHLLKRYQQHFQYVLVDEYQDTNSVQFELLRLLSAPQQNVFAVGDVDQSIYSFRHADFQIILRFQQDYEGASVIKLEHNYRSTTAILEAANTLIAHNRDRFEKVLISTRGAGEKLKLHQAQNEYKEADFVLAQIRKQQSLGQFDYGDVCVLYRTNAQSRLFEERLVQNNIPHQVVGAFRFYDRKEIKDLMAYLSVIYNPLDNLNFKRILNTPKRGMGAKSQLSLSHASEREGLSIWDVVQVPEVLATLPKRVQPVISKLMDWLKQLQDFQGSLAELIQDIYLQSGYQAELAKDDDTFEERSHYVQQFIQAARDFVPQSPETALGDFLEHLALLSDVDHLKSSGRLIRLMTVHAAKGLEFPVVFVTGLEEGVFPHQRAIVAEDDGQDGPIEEERRLMYVAMTRAQERLYLSSAKCRSLHGQTHYQEMSRFLEEIEPHLPADTIQKSVLDAEPMFDSFVPEPESGDLADLQKGESVYHPEFGNGTVEKVYSSGNRPIAIVHFPQGFGKRILDLRNAPLQRLSKESLEF